MAIRWARWFVCAVAFACLLDLASTYYASPDLEKEANALIVAVGANWTNTIAITVGSSIISVLLIYFALRCLENRRDRLRGQAGYDNVLRRLFLVDNTWTGQKDWADFSDS